MKPSVAKADWTVTTRVVVAAVRIPTTNIVIFCCIISYNGILLYQFSASNQLKLQGKLFPSLSFFSLHLGYLHLIGRSLLSIVTSSVIFSISGCVIFLANFSSRIL